jgi:LmbE family N-acetylglucosaminyl deacetylase
MMNNMSVAKKKSRSQFAALRKICKKPLFAKGYIILSIGVLLITTCYWALLSAHIQASNADQIVNTFLFERGDTFNGAMFPDQHTFLLKWPIFLLIKVFGSTSLAFTVATVGMTLLTVGSLAYIMYRIERRPLIFGTLCLALASTLLLVPIEPYPGGILPVNMAMVTTRNLEYIVFIVSMILVACAAKWQSWKFVAASLLMTILIASDKLFLTLSVGGALLAIIFYALIRKWSLVKLTAMWLVVGTVGAVLAIGVLWLVNASGVTHIADGTALGPYGLGHTVKEFALGTIHLILSLLTIIGANPASDTRLLATLPGQMATSLLSPHAIGFVVNAAIGVIGLTAIGRVVFTSIQRDKVKKKKHAVKPSRDVASSVSILLIWSTVAACGAFVISNHYYPVDARYVGIVLFTLFISLATFVRTRRFRRPELILLAGAVILVAIFVNMGITQSRYAEEKGALSDTNTRNIHILEALKHHHVDALVGDYWRVFPAKLESTTPLTVTPMAGCTQNRDVLSSQTWQLDLRQHSFAYILTLDQSLTGYVSCSLKDIVSQYGSPNRSVVVAGTIKQPKELLLFYDKGIHKNVAKIVNPVPATVTPTTIEKIPHTDCADSTIMNIVAHQDDDLLFMNPDLMHDIDAGHCVRTVYVTSGDAGTDKYYWLGREKGSEAAYSSMAGLAPDTIWIERIVKLPGGQFIVIANPQGHMKLSLIFMHLPDGNVDGQGFDSTNHESLSRLENGQVSAVHTADHQSIYSSSQLSDALTILMRTYQPNEIRTQANVVNHHYPDHSDHMAVGRYVKQAYGAYTGGLAEDAVPPLVFYIGYPIHSLSANVTDEDLARKQHTFFEYSHFDGGVCGSVAQCAQGTVYNIYLNRQYKSDY